MSASARVCISPPATRIHEPTFGLGDIRDCSQLDDAALRAGTPCIVGACIGGTPTIHVHTHDAYVKRRSLLVKRRS